MSNNPVTGGLDLVPGTAGPPVPTNGLRLVNVGGQLYSTTDGITFTVVGGSSTPTGTGFVHVTSGVQDAAAVPIIQMTDFIATPSVDGQTDLTCSISPLTGDTSGDLEFEGEIIYKGGSGSTSFFLRPIGATDTGLTCYASFNNGSDTWVNFHEAGWFIALTASATDENIIFSGRMCPKTGRTRQFYCRGSHVQTPTEGNILSTGFCTDTSTVVTALTIHSSVASTIRTGSYIKVRALGNSQ